MGKVEEVARAIWADREKAAAAIGIPLPAWEFESDELRSDVRREARAAIEAMREPDRRILDSLRENLRFAWGVNVAEPKPRPILWRPAWDEIVRPFWREAIDAALQERSGS